MSDRDAILRLLQRVDRRVRTNRLFYELSAGAALFLILPVIFKIWDLFYPVRAITITAALLVWFAAFAGYVVWRVLQKTTLDHAAVSVDQKAGLHDEIKTAFWFIHHPRSSDWIDAQLARASSHAKTVNIEALYPRMLPRTSYVVAGLILAFIALNFLPLPLNHNWLALQAAPAFSLTPEQQAILKQLQEFLKKEAPKDPKLAERFEEILRQLQDENIDPAKATELLNELQKLLDDRATELAELNEGLQEIAKDLQESDELKETGDAMMQKQLREAAERMRESANQMQSESQESLQKMQESLEKAAEKSANGLEELSQDLNQAAQSLKNKDQNKAQEALEKAARDLEKLQDQIQADQAAQTASRELRNLQQSLKDRPKSEQGQQQTSKQQNQGQPQQGEGDDQDSSSSQTEPSSESSNSKAGQGEAQDAEGNGNGLNTSDQPTNAPREGAPTRLDVLLAKEKLSGMPVKGSKPQEMEEISRQQRSMLDYRNVKSELSAGQKDLLNQEQIPWEYRPLIKNYFQAIRPDVKK